MARESSSPTKRYRHYCGIAYALDLVGDRWTLLIARELLLGPRRYTDLNRGLPGIPSNLLSSRLRELEENGLVTRRELPPPAASTVYQLTKNGEALKEPILALGRFGARHMAAPKPDDEVSSRWLVLGMLCTFDNAEGRDLPDTVQLRIGDDEFALDISATGVAAKQGTITEPQMTLRADFDVFAQLLLGELPVDDAVTSGVIECNVGVEPLTRFVEAFDLRLIMSASNR